VLASIHGVPLLITGGSAPAAVLVTAGRLHFVVPVAEGYAACPAWHKLEGIAECALRCGEALQRPIRSPRRSAAEQRSEPEGPALGGLQVDGQIETGRPLDWRVGELGTFQGTIDLFNDLAGADKQRRRQRQAERVRGLEIDDQDELGRKLDQRCPLRRNTVANQYIRRSHCISLDRSVRCGRVAKLRHAVSHAALAFARIVIAGPLSGTGMSKPETLAALIAAILFASAWAMAVASRRK
jgi:hypothetical protein